MSDSRAARLASIFERAVDLDPAAQQRLLDAECGDDDGLRGELERLLAADAGAAAAMLDAVFDDRRWRPGELVAGRYRVIRKVGEGGMGVVFEAEQQEPRRRVALKCIRADWLDADSLQRFRREAQALGRLQHPGIAQVFEAGVTDGEPAVPFLAMEFVDGTGLLEFAHGLPLRERLRLLAEIAEAVGHAHERGVVHRDIKPSNVLVETGSAGPRPRVLDFGVARFTEGDVALQTRTNQIVGTLAYMSPEQLSHGSSIADPRSDVWSLGVTAYELLAERLPLSITGMSLPDAALALRNDEPARIDRVVPGLRGDAATIVHKALAKDPARRYANAGAMAADLRRLLSDQPITARRASALYVASRLVRRHRGLFAGLTAAFAALAAGLIVAVVLATQAAADRDRAQRRTDDLRSLVRTLVRDIDRELEQVPGTTAARRLLLEAGQHNAEAMAAEAGNSADTLLEVASVFEVLANVQGKPGTSNLGDPKGALENLDRALGLVDRAKLVAPDESRLYGARQRLLQSRDSLLRVLGLPEERLANLRALQREVAEIARRWPGPDTDMIEARAAANLGRLQVDLGQFDDGLENYDFFREHLERRITLGTASNAEDAREDQENLRIILVQIGMLQDRRGFVPAARSAFDRAVKVGEQIATTWPDLNSQRSLAGVLRSHATHCLEHADVAGALSSLQRARDLIAPLAGAEASNIDLQRLAAIIDFGIGDALIKSKRSTEGIEVLRAYLRRMENLVEKTNNPQLSRDLIPGQQSLAEELARAGQFEEAEQVAKASVDLAKRRATAAPEQAMEQDDLLGSLGIQAFVFELGAQRTGLAEAEALLLRRRAADTLEAQVTLLRELQASNRLEARRRSMLEELPPRIAKLRGEQH
jgi:eukaryotic-like serine/threonine-protein kinase